VLGCVADGLTNSEAATRLGVGAATVRSHLDRIFTKTGTTHRAAAVAMALRRGWVV
jgi:DNA-binding CsgD family transcriptional regulator